jgi:cbb3-type cytochrome oxidase cytochrome c subunit
MSSKHEIIEKNIGLMALLMVLAVSVGGLTQIVPLFFQDVTNEPVEGMKARTPRWNWKAATCTSRKAVSAATRR